MTPPPLPEYPRDTEQIRLLVVLHYIKAGLSLAALIFIALHFFFMSSVVGIIGNMPDKVTVPRPVEEDASREMIPSPDADPDGPAEEVQSVEIHTPMQVHLKAMKSSFRIFIYLYIFWAALALLGMILNFMSARYLGQRRKKVFSMITAGVNCLSIPLGTALGIFTLVVLSRSSVERIYLEKR
ncbi:hypothetical protein N9891_01100 [bacterium]|nr:hypothetical protein [bacterium]